MSALKLVRERVSNYDSENSLSKINHRSLDIHCRAIAKAKTYLTAESDLLDIFEELENDRTYLAFGETSIYQYAQKYLNLSESVICHFTSIVRKSKSVPELKEAIREGFLSVSKARKIVPVITAENKDVWLELATSSSSREIEKAVANEIPKLLTQESITYRTADRLELKLGVSEEWYELLKITKDVASQKTQKSVDTEEALKLAMEFYLKHHDPLEKSKRAIERLEKKYGIACIPANQETATPEAANQIPECKIENESPVRPVVSRVLPVPGPVKLVRRQHLHSAIKHAVTWRDQRRCTFLHQDKSRCTAKRWLDVHHIVEVQNGGTNELANLKTLCSHHHAHMHDLTARTEGLS